NNGYRLHILNHYRASGSFIVYTCKYCRMYNDIDDDMIEYYYCLDCHYYTCIDCFSKRAHEWDKLQFCKENHDITYCKYYRGSYRCNLCDASIKADRYSDKYINDKIKKILIMKIAKIVKIVTIYA